MQERVQITGILQPTPMQIQGWYKDLVRLYAADFKETDLVAQGKEMAIAQLFRAVGLSDLNTQAQRVGFGIESEKEVNLVSIPQPLTEWDVEGMYIRLVLESAISLGYTPKEGRTPESVQEEKSMRFRSVGYISQMSVLFRAVGQEALVNKALQAGKVYVNARRQ